MSYNECFTDAQRLLSDLNDLRLKVTDEQQSKLLDSLDEGLRDLLFRLLVAHPHHQEGGEQ